jgi:hypothetical protein
MISAYQGNEPYIFISYSHKDSADVLKILEHLDENGFRVWYDSGIEAGTEFPAYIAERVDNCEVFIAFMSKNAQSSDFCREEIYYAKDQKKEILVVYLEEFVLDGGLRLRLGALQAMYKYRFPSNEDFVIRLCSENIIKNCRKASAEIKPSSIGDNSSTSKLQLMILEGKFPILLCSNLNP